MNPFFEEAGKVNFEENVRILEARFGGGWWKRLAALEIPPEFEIQTAKNGLPTLVVTQDKRRLTLHSRFDPADEASRFIDEQVTGGISEVMVYGFGLGYHIEALRKKIGENGRVMVVDMRPEPFVLALILRNLVSLLEWKGLRLVIFGLTVDALDREFDRFLKLDPETRKMIVHVPSMEIMPEEIKAFKDQLEQFRIGTTTSRRFGKNIRDNEAANLEKTAGKDIGELFGSRRGETVIVAGAGPSLDRNVGLLALNPGADVALISSDGALGTILNAGRRPEYVVSIDPQERVLRYFENPPVKLDMDLVYSMRNFPRVKELFSGARWMFLPEEEGMRRPAGFKDWGALLTGGSVAIAGMDLGVKMGAARIVFAGMDLGFTGGGVCASDSPFSDEKYKAQTEIMVEGVDGSLIPTTPVFKSFKRTIERYVKDHPKVEFIDATEGGARIEGTRILTLREALKL